MKRWIAIISALVLVGGCNLLSNLFGPQKSGSAQLKRFTSQKELSDYLTGQIDSRHLGTTGGNRSGIFDFFLPATDAVGLPGTAAQPPTAISNESGGSTGVDSDSATGFSQTTLQEAGVDEADVVKTDGTYLYIIDHTGVNSVLRIIQVSPPESMTLVSETPLEGYGQDIYLLGDKVVSLTSKGGGFFGFVGGGVIIDPLPAMDVVMLEDVDVGADVVVDVGTSDSATGSAPEIRYERPRTVVTIIDVTDRHQPAVLSETSFDGVQSSSRLIDGVLHLVVSNFQNYFIDIIPMLGQPGLDVRSINASDLLPQYVRVDESGNTTSGDVVTWRELYRPTDPDGFGIVTLISLDVDNDASFTSVGVVAEPGLIYSSLEAMYLTDTNYDFSGDLRVTTDIYKFTYINRGADATAMGTVPGRILNQYSMGEYQGYLRVASTIIPTFLFTGPGRVSSNSVYVLDQVGDSLAIVGQVEGIAPRETIQAARFIGDRGYVVTFEQIDPLFTLDLSDPFDPKVIGELEVPGFSTFIVPMDDDHLLTVGQYVPPPGEFGPWGVQLSIYDISDFAHPTLMDNVIIGDQMGAWSEALSNPKAFTYFAVSNLVALPISMSGGFVILENPAVDLGTGNNQTGSGDGTDPGISVPPTDVIVDVDAPVMSQSFDGVVVFRATVTDGFTKLGQISTRFDNAFYYGSAFTRGVFIQDNVFAITNRGVRGGPVADVESVPFELLLPDPISE